MSVLTLGTPLEEMRPLTVDPAGRLQLSDPPGKWVRWGHSLPSACQVLGEVPQGGPHLRVLRVGEVDELLDQLVGLSRSRAVLRV